MNYVLPQSEIVRNSPMKYKHSIKAVSIRAGLSPHVIRIWEKRYGAVQPERSSTNRRQYSEEDVERLVLLRRATEEGHKIGQIAKLTNDELLNLLSPSSMGLRPLSQDSVTSGESGDGTMHGTAILDELMEAVIRYDNNAFHDGLSRASVAMSRMRLLEDIVIPLIRRVDEMWTRGSLRMAHEHMVSSILRSFLTGLDATSHLPPGAPSLVITTPSGQVHEMGALISASAAVLAGWRVIYLGADLPADEICAAVENNQAAAVALSLVYPTDDHQLGEELRTLRKLLPDDVAIIVGGRALPAYLDVLDQIGAKIMTDMKSFCRYLGKLGISSASGTNQRNLA
jgi:DNA-binding transcriptional MerR regulator/methylmalonyl-CoA mutase cobalamin-binding subunit